MGSWTSDTVIGTIICCHYTPIVLCLLFYLLFIYLYLTASAVAVHYALTCMRRCLMELDLLLCQHHRLGWLWTELLNLSVTCVCDVCLCVCVRLHCSAELCWRVGQTLAVVTTSSCTAVSLVSINTIIHCSQTASWLPGQSFSQLTWALSCFAAAVFLNIGCWY